MFSAEIIWSTCLSVFNFLRHLSVSSSVILLNHLWLDCEFASYLLYIQCVFVHKYCKPHHHHQNIQNLFEVHSKFISNIHITGKTINNNKFTNIISEFGIPRLPELWHFLLAKWEYISSDSLSSSEMYAFLIASLYLALHDNLTWCRTAEEGLPASTQRLCQKTESCFEPI